MTVARWRSKVWPHQREHIMAKIIAGLVITVFGVVLNTSIPACAQSDLARAYRIIASKKFVDLTHSFLPDTPVWSGFGQAKFSPASDPKTKEPYTIAKDGF